MSLPGIGTIPALRRLKTRAELDAEVPPAAPILQFLESLYQDEYTGLIVLHFCQGVAKKAEFPGQQIVLAADRRRQP